MIIVWQSSIYPSSLVPDYSPAYISDALAKVPGDPPSVPFNTTDTYVTVSGAINGVNTSFTLSATPTMTLQLYRNGAELSAGASADYTLVGDVVTFNAGSIPQTGDVLVAIALLTTAYTTVTGAINGVNTVFTLPSIPNFLALFRNGILQNPGMPAGAGDYVLSGTTITFNAGSIPQTGDILLAKTQ